ncbi:MAG TPA: elongation factor G [Candidatus Binataceae bacterium]|nr:elongation factor G [Candidatus Binataceae bacterium]
MAVEEIGRLRTIAIVGQGGAGKSQLAEAMLFTAGATTRLGRPDDGTAVMDFEPEELQRHVSISSSFHHLNWKRTEVILANTPGYSAFLPDTFNTLKAVDGAVLLISPGNDMKVESEKIWTTLSEARLPRVVFVSRLDRERSSFDAALKDLEKHLEAKPVALTLPIGEEAGFTGVIDVLAMKALNYADTSGKPREEELIGLLKERAEKARNALFEAIAETDDELLEEYLDKGTLPEDKARAALHVAVAAGKITPVFSGSGTKNIGVGPLLDAITTFLPAPNERPAVKAQHPTNGQEQERAADPNAPFAALVFKTVIDPFVGKLSIFRVMSGRAQSDATVFNASHESKERFGQLLRLEGKKQSPLASALPGEIVAVAKLKDTVTGDTLCDEKSPVMFDPPVHPAPVISFAIRPKSKGDEEKASAALHKLVEEDTALEMHRDPQTHEIILSGTGQMHIEVTVEKLKRKFNVEVELQSPKVPYKEAIKGRAEAQGKYKRQSGGRGQYGDCWLKVEPLPRGKGFEFEDKIVGGSIPRQFIPSVEKGVRSTLVEGFLAGYPVMDVKVTVYDGSYHDVDSSDMAFQIAASMGLKAALEKAKPIILEPIVAMEVACPDECMGDVIGDLNSRRGKVLGMDRKGQSQVIKAVVPMSEVLKYAPDLRSITSGRGSFEQHFSHYEEAPPPVAEKIIRETNAAREASKQHAHA